MKALPEQGETPRSLIEPWLDRLASVRENPLSLDEQLALCGDLGEEAARRNLAGMPDSAFFFDENAVLNASLELKGTIDNLLRLALPRFADWAMVDLFDDRNDLRTFAMQHCDPEMQRAAPDMENRAHFDDLTGPRGVPKVARTGEYDLLETIPDAVIDQGVPNAKDRALYRAWGLNSSLVVPLRSRGRLIGTLAFFYGKSQKRYAQSDVAVVQDFANRAAQAIDNARTYEREHKVANTLQLATLPARLPRVPGLIFDKAYYPGALDSEVGGDWYDAFMLPDGRVALSMGDVGGKGLDAAVLMSEIRHSIRASALDDRCTPADVLDRANRLLALGGASLMVTAFFGFLSPISLELIYASAGHPGPVLVTADGVGRVLETDGVPLGIDFEDPPGVFQIQLATGSLLVLYTDGLLEFDRDLIGTEQKIIEAAIEARVSRPRNLAAALARRVLGQSSAGDDIAILSLYLDDQPTKYVDVTLPAIPPSAALIRRAVELFAQGVGIDESQLFALQVSVGEAVINSIEHAYSMRGGEFTVKLESRGTTIAATIEDHGSWRAMRLATGPVLERERGRGFSLIKAFAEDVHVKHTGAGTTVKFVLATST